MEDFPTIERDDYTPIGAEVVRRVCNLEVMGGHPDCGLDDEVGSTLTGSIPKKVDNNNPPTVFRGLE